MYCPIEAFPTEFEIDEEDGDFSVLTPLAMSDDGARMVAVETRLLVSGDRSGEYEFKFCIAVHDEETGIPFRIFASDMARGYLPDELRSWVIPCVQKAAVELCAAVQPQVIYRVTNATRPPEKALVKHHMITDTLVEQGLRVEEDGTDHLGRRYWRMCRNGEEHG